MRCRLNSSTWM